MPTAGAPFLLVVLGVLALFGLVLRAVSSHRALSAACAASAASGRRLAEAKTNLDAVLLGWAPPFPPRPLD